MKLFLTAFKILVFVLLGFLAYVFIPQTHTSGLGNIFLSSVLFQSLESTTADQTVFNKIRWIPGWKQDVWMMNQSQKGLQAPHQQWDRLAIIVDKSTTPSTALYLQLPPGELEWTENLRDQAIKNRVSCFMCHANGPRIIRADETSLPLSLKDRIQIQIWNRWIKNYGRVVEDPRHSQQDPTLETPFRFRTPLENDTLQAKTCIKCHNENNERERGFLTRQNAVMISFLVEQGFMPPSEKLSESEKKQIQKFLVGF